MDAILAVLLVMSVVMGFTRGFIRIGIGLLATIAGILLAAWFYRLAGIWMEPIFHSRLVANVLAFWIIFALVLWLGVIASWLLGKMIGFTGLTWLDRLLGAGVGAVRGLLLAVMVVMLLVAFTPGKAPGAVVESRSAPYLIEAARLAAALTPYELKDGFRRRYEDIQKLWKDATKRNKKKLPAQEL
ncbi:MAG: CvpA family protein [Acidobacteria bacterium]|nr:CvpA family protein [Acidobacteriota bacterium]MBI3281020.1 CvpA family protein [Acidobacteriota bacterium]